MLGLALCGESSTVLGMPASDDHQDRPQPSAVELLRQGLQALARKDWEALRSICHDGIVWRIPGRSPLAGELVGPDAVVARYQLMISETASDRPAAIVALFGEGDYAVLVQTNDILEVDGTARPITALTLVRARDGRLAELQYFVSDQYVVDKLWLDRLGRVGD